MSQMKQEHESNQLNVDDSDSFSKNNYSKLYFKYGTVASAKSLNMISAAETYRYQDKNIIVMKPAVDTRFSKDAVSSRTGAEYKVDFLITSVDVIKNFDYKSKDIKCVLVDEAQFLSEECVDALRQVTKYCPVMCYGLRADYKTHLFPGSKRLCEIADSISEIKTTCKFCNSKSTQNMKFVNGKKVTDGSAVIELGADELYAPVCWKHYVNTDLVV